MNLRFSRLWPLFFITAFLFVPKFTLAAEWTNIGFANNNVKTVTVDPKNNQKILVSLASIFEDSYNFITENGGTSWAPISMGGATTQCNGFVINPKTPNEIWAGCAVGLFRSIDGGNNFIVISNFQRTQSVNASVSVDGTVYITTAGNSLYKSTDGLIWETLRPPTSNNPPIVFTNKYAANEVYLSLAGTGAVGLYKSTDWGATWMPLNVLVPINKGVNQLIFLSFGKMCASISTQGIGCSTDGGFTWETIASPNPTKPSEYQHFYRLEQNPDDENNLLVLAGTWGGLDTKIYSYKSNGALPEILAIPDYTGAITISQGMVYSWSQNLTWTKGIWRNDGIAVVPEYLKKHPVIIVPGILGSWSWTNSSSLVLDPVLHSYTDLVDTFRANGFILEKDLFVFPYNWRIDNNFSGVLLKQKINEVKRVSGALKVDIVAHSMGGIVSRVYAESSFYEGDIDQIVFLGTPHLGSPESYPVWEAGDVSFNRDKIQSAIFKYIFTKEANLNNFVGDEAIYRYIQSSVPTIGQLLPIYNYLGWYGNTEQFDYPALYPRNTFLEQLNANKFLIGQRGIRVANIVNIDKSTPSSFGLYTYPGLNEIWNDGIPYNYQTNKAGVYYDKGDGTVPTGSATGLEGINTFVSGVNHGDLPKFCINEIFTAMNIPLINKPSFFDTVKKYLFIAAYSPVDFYILAPDGRRIGFNINGEAFNEIDGAYYTGNDSEMEFITIPNPLPGVYKVITYGTDTGKYEIEATYADDDRDISFSSSYVGQAEPGKEDNLIVTLSPETDSINTNVEDRIAPNVVIDLNKSIFTHWDTLIMTCDASDSESGVEEFIVRIDGNDVNCEETINLFEQSLGSHNIEYMAKDKAGNVKYGEYHYVIEANYVSLAKDIIWLYESSHFRNKGDAFSILAQIEISRFLDLMGKQQKSADALVRAQQFVDKSKEKNRIDIYGYDMITNDIKYILEGK